MKITRHEILSNPQNLKKNRELQKYYTQIQSSIKAVTWPLKSNLFSLNPVPKGNGVKPIKNKCMEYLKSNKWDLEKPLDIATRVKPGPIDAVIQLKNKKFVAVEWETGNISSSHRAMNKLALGCLNEQLILGVLILPSRAMYKFLTDRVGNYQELEPYFDIWRTSNSKGTLMVIEIEHDVLSTKAPKIPKGTDGRALR